MPEEQEAWNSLPELDDGRAGARQVLAGHVGREGGVGQRGVHQGAVLAGVLAEALDAVGRVPRVAARGPGQRGVEGLDEVVEAPGQHHDVVGVAEEHDDHGRIAQAWRR